MARGEATRSEGALNRRHRVVLWALAISRPQPASLDRIAEALWSGTQPATRDKVIQGSISLLRKVYGVEAIRTVTGGYRLSPSVVTACDDFERQVAHGQQLLTVGQADRAAFVLADALGSWTGAPYHELAHWPDAVAEQARLTELTLQAEELHVDALLAAGRTAEALPLARRCATAQPLRESRWMAWAKAAHHAGQQADALQVLRDCRECLRDELGVDPSDELAALELAVLRQDASLAPPPRADATQAPPWRGLDAYQQSDADDFFGRDEDVERGLRVLNETGVLAVAGPSGIGKSSFVRAGLGAALVRSGITVHVTTPQDGLPTSPAEVLVLDQAEELFALADADELVQRLDETRVVLSIRTDRLAEASEFPALARLLERGLFLLGGLDEHGLRQAIEQPALQSGLVLEPGLVDLLLRDIEGQPAALPMFSHALVATWLGREGRTLTIDGYIAAGGVRGAVARTAESLYARLDPSRHGELRSLMLRLVRTDDQGDTSRVRFPTSRMAARNDLVEELVAARLVTIDEGWVSITHEALITAWPRFRDWLADDVEGRRQLQHVAQAASTWEEMGRPRSELYRGARLERAVAWADATTLELSRAEHDFLAAGRDAQAAEHERERREVQRQRRTNRRLRGLAAGLAVVTALAVLAGVLAVDQQRRAVAEARVSAAAGLEADANRVAALALNTGDAQLSLLLAVAAERLAPGVVTGRSLSAALAARTELMAIASPTPEGTPASGFGGLATGGSRLYGLDDHHVLHVFTTSLRPLDTIDLGNGRIARSPARVAATTNLVAAAAGPGEDPAIVLLDSRSLEPLGITLERLPQRDVRVASLDLSMDGKTIGAALETPRGTVVMVWKVLSGDLLGQPIAARDDTTLRLSADGRRLFTSNPLRAYDVASGRLLWHAPAGAGIDVHEDLVAASTAQGSRVRILDASTGRTVRTLVGNQGSAYDLAFSPNGASLAAYVDDGNVMVWSTMTGRIEHSLRTGAEHGIAYSAYGDTLFTGGTRLGSLLAWDLLGRRSFLTRIPIDGFQSLSEGTVRVSPDGSWVSMSRTVRGSPELRLGRARADSDVEVVVPGPGWRGIGAWSPDARRYAYADGGGFVTVVNPGDGSRLRREQVASRPIVALAYAGEGLLIALVEGSELVVVDAETLSVEERLAVPPVATGLTANSDVAVVTSAASESGASWRAPVVTWHAVSLDPGSVVADGDVGVTSASAVSVSPDGSRLALGGEQEDLAIVAFPSGATVDSTGQGAGERVAALAWSPDGSQLVASIGSRLSLWDSRGTEISEVALPTGEVSSAAGFAPDGSITIATLAGNVYRWDPSPLAAVEFACRVAGRDLTRGEWRVAFGDRPVRPVCP